MKTIATALAALSAAALLVLAAVALTGALDATASQDGSMDAISIDMDPSSVPGNTATSVGSREFCARINENDLLDADEDSVDSLEIDVTTGPDGIPKDHPMFGFTFLLSYDPASLSVIRNDVSFLLAVRAGSSLFDASDILPDQDGEFAVAAIDVAESFTASESGPGVLSRLAVEASSGALEGVHHLVLGDAAHVDTYAEAFLAQTVNHAVVAIDADCPADQPEPVHPPTPTPGPATPTATPAPSPTTPTPLQSPTADPTATPDPTSAPLATSGALEGRAAGGAEAAAWAGSTTPSVLSAIAPGELPAAGGLGDDRRTTGAALFVALAGLGLAASAAFAIRRVGR